MGDEEERLWGGGVISYYLSLALQQLGHAVWRCPIGDREAWVGATALKSDAIICHGVPATRVEDQIWDSSQVIIFWWLSEMFYGIAEMSGSPFDAVAGNSPIGIAAVGETGQLAKVIELATDESFLHLHREDSLDVPIVYLGMYPHKSDSQMKVLFDAASEFGLGIWGRGWEHSPYSQYYRGRLPLADIGKLYSRASIALLLTETRQQKLGMINNRVFEVLGAGATAVSEDYEYLRQHELGRYIEFVSTSVGAKRTFERILSSRSIYEQRGKECREIIRSHHTYSRAARQFLKLIEDVPTHGRARHRSKSEARVRQPAQFSGLVSPSLFADALALFVSGGAGSVLRYDKWWGTDFVRFGECREDWRRRSLLVFLPKGSASPRATAMEGAPSGGCQALVGLPCGSTQACCLQYWVKFGENFDFVKGGKLPGLFGGTQWSGGTSSWERDKGFSTRFMWRREGIAEVYAYLPSRVTFGLSLQQHKWHFKRGVRNYVKQTVRLNDVGKTNGLLIVEVDEQCIFESSEIVYRTREDVNIDGVVFSVFFGGGDVSWAASHDEVVEFGGFSIDDLVAQAPNSTR